MENNNNTNLKISRLYPLMTRQSGVWKPRAEQRMLFTVFAEATRTRRINKQILWQHTHTHFEKTEK